MAIKYLAHGFEIDKESFSEFESFFMPEKTSQKVLGFIKRNR